MKLLTEIREDYRQNHPLPQGQKPTEEYRQSQEAYVTQRLPILLAREGIV